MTTDVLTIEPLLQAPHATIVPPGSKSLTNRALILAAQASGHSTLQNPLIADDSLAMLGALEALGATIVRDDAMIRIGPIQPSPNQDVKRVNARLSGTTSRFVLPLAALVGQPVIVDGDAPLRRRPMGPIVDALRALGVQIDELQEHGCLPLRVDGSDLRGGMVAVDATASSQFLSALLLSAPSMNNGLTVTGFAGSVARPFVAMTMRMITDFGGQVDQIDSDTIRVDHGGLVGRSVVIESDATAATYFWAAAAITGGQVTVKGVDTSSCQGDVRFVDVLQRMGAQVTHASGSITVAGRAAHGIDVDLSELPDTAQTLAAVAVFADAPTRVRGIGFARGHETDRLAAVVGEMRNIGISAQQTDDGFIIEPGTPRGGTVETHNDHRMAMSFSLIGLRSPGIVIASPDVVGKTYPGFWHDLQRLSS